VGGYYLKREPHEITLAEVVRALQGPIEEMLALEDDEQPRPGQPPSSRHVTQGLWRELAEHVQSWFAGVTIADLVRRGDELGIPRAGVGQPMYFI
jgi:DNA-binding IscR family transcriptional regulator